MTTWKKGKDGRFAGSIGAGRANVPTAAPSSEATASPVSSDPASSADISRATAWELFQARRVDQGLGRSPVSPGAVTTKYEIVEKAGGRNGTYCVARVAGTPEIEEFPNWHQAEDWARMKTGEPLQTSSVYGYESYIRKVNENDVYSDSQPGMNVPVIEYREKLNGPTDNRPHTFRVYRHANPDSPTAENWSVDFDYPDPLTTREFDGGRLWEGDDPPTKEDLQAAWEDWRERGTG